MVWSSFGDFRGLWILSRYLRCLLMRLFILVSMTLSTAVSDFGSWRYRHFDLKYIVLAASGASDQSIWGVYECVFSWRFQWHYRLPCPTSVAGDIAVLVWSSYGGLMGLWSGLCGVYGCAFLWLLRWHHRRPIARVLVLATRWSLKIRDKE